MTLLSHFAGTGISSTEGVCPPIGSVVGERTQGDVNCDDEVDARDALAVLWHVVGLPLDLPNGCGGP
jgi:hypothetical protein